MTTHWTPRLGMPPSPNELRVLYALAVLHAPHGEFQTAPQVHDHISTTAAPFLADWSPSVTTVRAHLQRLLIKGHVSTRGFSVVRYAPTDDGRLALFAHIRPDLNYVPDP